MKTLISSSFLLLLAGAVLTAQETTDYYRQYSGAPLPVINRTGGGDTRLFLVSSDDQDLIFRYQPTDRREIGVPIDTNDLQIYYPPPQELLDAMRSYETGNLDRAISQMRQYVYPMVPYLEVPASKFNIHPYVERFTTALVQSDGYEAEAAALFRRIPLDSVSPEFGNQAIRLVEKLVEAGMNNDAMILLNRLPLTGPNSILPRIMSFANHLRNQGNIDEALFLYQRVMDIPDVPEARTALLWTSYCNLIQGRMETARLFLRRAGELEPSDPGYSLKQLILGRIHLLNDDVMEAMAEISRGVVFTDVVEDWAAEIIFTAGHCYELLSKPNTAREVYGEVILFYPSTTWGERSKERLEVLPPAAPRIVDAEEET